MLTFKVEQIKHLGPPDRIIISVAGMPFYQSSGTNSGLPDTWFPFFGLAEQDGSGLKKGDYIKPINYQLDRELLKIIQETTLARRFWKLPCLWVSAELGGGFWLTQKGIKLKAFLDLRYFNLFPDMLPKLQFLQTGFQSDSNQNINVWLLERAKISTVIDLPKIFPNTLLDLGAQLDQNENKSKLRL